MRKVFAGRTALVTPDDLEKAGAPAASSRMDPASRYVVAASSLVLDFDGLDGDRTGVYLGSGSGCLDVDLRFAATLDTRPSPRLFARTLPSTPAAEVAVRYGLSGPVTCFVQEREAGVTALAAAVQDIVSGACDFAVAGEYDVVDPGLDPRGRQYAAAVFLSVHGQAGWREVRVESGSSGPRSPGMVAGSVSSLTGLFTRLGGESPGTAFDWPGRDSPVRLAFGPADPVRGFRFLAFSYEGGKACGQLEVPSDGPFTSGHFPGNPVLPGVAQVGVARLVCEKALGKPVRIESIRKAKFLAQVRPGSVLEFAVDVDAARGRATWVLSEGGARVSVGDMSITSDRLPSGRRERG